MTIDVYSATGTKGKQLTLPESLFGADVNYGLMHQAVVRQQSGRRQSPAHVLTRAEVSGSTKKLFEQKHTGRARRGDSRSPSLRGGGKAFGPRNAKNYEKDMPKKMRHAALRSCLSLQAGKGIVIGLESFGTAIKTKTLTTLLGKMSIENVRNVLIVSKGVNKPLVLSARNVPGVTVVPASYLNPEAVLHARHLVFLTDAIEEADAMFGKKHVEANTGKTKEHGGLKSEAPKKKAAPAKKATKTVAKPAAKKKSASKKSA
jgi:large subunit ribosomal protein L4